MTHTQAPEGADPIQALAAYQAQEPTAPADLVTRAAAVQVVDQASADKASGLRAEIATVRKGIEDAIAVHKSNAHKTWKALCDEESRQTAPLKALEAAIGARILDWQTEERRRIEEERRIELAKAEAEAKAERERRAEELRQQGLTKTAAQEIAKTEVASALYEKQVAAANVAAPKVAGSATREVWTGTVTDLKALCRSIADGKAPVHLVTVAQAEVNRLAAATKGPSTIPGLTFTKGGQNVRAGGRR